MDTAEGALVQLRAYISQSKLNPNDRLPSERKLCDLLGVTRCELRKAFAVLETEGTIWRHVGRGTFIGDGVSEDISLSITAIAKNTTPREVMQARLLLEPLLAREAAFHATAQHMDALQLISNKTHRCKSWREYETLDNQFHRLFAEASQNTALLAMFDQLNALRRTVVWGRLRQRPDHPPKDHHSFGEHQALIEAVKNRDGDQAQTLMHQHLQSVTSKLFPE
ncbi:MAG: FadR family transcriptional regulator [Oceanospirillaceae bacterium]|nr:FadR family transcriptional regulator [Oceanospirillaceae bacterium]